jgi:hypothetical protein
MPPSDIPEGTQAMFVAQDEVREWCPLVITALFDCFGD